MLSIKEQYLKYKVSENFYRVEKVDRKLKNSIYQLLKRIKKNGYLIDGEIKRPSYERIDEIQKKLSLDFQVTREKVEEDFIRVFPNGDKKRIANIIELFYQNYLELKNRGKSLGMIKNLHIKHLGWLMYEIDIFDPIKNIIIFLGEPNDSEKIFLRVLSSLNYEVLNIKKEIGDILLEEIDDKVYTNIWCESEDFFEESLKIDRGEKEGRYNLYVLQYGVKDIDNFEKDLNGWYNKISKEKKVLLFEEGIPVPTVEEIDNLVYKRLENKGSFLQDGQHNFKIQKSFLRNILIEGLWSIVKNVSQEEYNRLSNRLNMVFCWSNRYLGDLLENNYPVVIYYGSPTNKNEIFFLNFLSRLPIDIFIIAPNKEDKIEIEDLNLEIVEYDSSLELKKFPKESKGVESLAYGLERDLDKILYKDTGIYREKQFSKARSARLKITYDEIKILWNVETKYRVGFKVEAEEVIIPNICSKISGVEDRDIKRYFRYIRDLENENTYIIEDLKESYFEDKVSYTKEILSVISQRENLIGRLKVHKNYKLSFLRVEIQEYILEKLVDLIESGIIKGTFETGMEYLIVDTVLNMDIKILRMLQNFDFTKVPPKLMVLNFTEERVNREYAILIAYLSIIGFDILIFTPTGYRNIEQYYSKDIFLEHKIGDFMYDLKFEEENQNILSVLSDFTKIFKRG